MQGEVEDTIARLNFHYGEHRNIDRDMGGYILVIEYESDYEKVKEILNQHINELNPAYVKKIVSQTEPIHLRF